MQRSRISFHKNSQFYCRIINKPDEAVFQTVTEGMLKMENELTVIQLSEGALKGHFKANPFWQQTVKTFAKEPAAYRANIWPKNSPLVPLFRKGAIIN